MEQYQKYLNIVEKYKENLIFTYIFSYFLF